MDIKAVCIIKNLPNGDPKSHYNALTASRDNTVKLWEIENTCKLIKEFKFHSRYVNAITYIKANNVYPEGLIISGGNDTVIYAYKPISDEPLYALIGHTDNICKLYIGTDDKIISGSWDGTARIWKDMKCQFILKGHDGAVWSLCELSDGIIITGSSDKTIRFWNNDKCINICNGHTDVVRDIKILNQKEFVSCGNDGNIIIWTNDGQIMNRFLGHNAFIYSLDVNKDGYIISGGEDMCINIWDRSKKIKSIAYPASSVWSINSYETDFCIGGSDGMIRIFSSDKHGIPNIINDYNDCLARNSESLDIDQLPTIETLGEGKKIGETKVIRSNDNKAIAYCWNGNKWEFVGNVIGSNIGKNDNSKKKSADFVFKIDIEDGKPNLDLEYNHGEDPWLISKKFIENNNLPISHLNQLVEFINKNTGGKSNKSINSNYIFFQNVNCTGLVNKILEINQNNDILKLKDDDMQAIYKFINIILSPNNCDNMDSEKIFNIIMIGLQWPLHFVFPILDLMRIINLNETALKNLIQYSKKNLIEKMIDLLQDNSKYLTLETTEKTKLSRCIIRWLSNFFFTRVGQEQLTENVEKVFILFNMVKNDTLDSKIPKSFTNK